MDFKNAKELLALCEERKLCISDVMRRREIEKGEITGEICDARMKKAYEIMRESVRGESLGGGKARICRINQVEVDFTGEYSAAIVIH